MAITESDMDALWADEPSPTPNAAPPQPAPRAWMDADVGALFDKLDSEDDDRLRGLLTFALPDGVKHRDALLDLSQRTGRPMAELEAKHDELVTRWDSARRDVKRFRKESPELAAFLLENPAMAEMVVKDQQLSIFSTTWNAVTGYLLKANEQLFNKGTTPEERAQVAADIASKGGEWLVTPKPGTFRKDAVTARADAESGLSRLGTIVGSTWRQSTAGMDRNKLGFDLMLDRTVGRDTWNTEKRIQDLSLEALPRDFSTGPWEQTAADLVEGTASQVAVYEDAGPVMELTVGAGALVGAVAGSIVGPEGTGAGALAGARLGASVGSRLGVFWGSVKLEAGGAYLEFLKAEKDDGKLVSEEEARGFALLYGLAAAGVEVVGFEAFLSSLGGFGKAAMAHAPRLAMAEMSKSQWLREVAVKLGKDMAVSAGKSTGAEFLEEVTQAALQDVSRYALRSASAGQLQKMEAPDVESYLLQGQKAALGAAGMTAAINSAQAPIAVMRLQEALRDGDKVAAIARLKDSTTARVAPAAVARMVEEAGARNGEPLTHLYVDAQAFAEAVQQQGAQPEAVAKELLGEEGPTLLQSAIKTGSKLEVSVEQYLQRWGTSPLGQALTEDIALRPDADTTRQARAKQAMQEAVTETVMRRGEELLAQYDSGEAPSDVHREALSLFEQQAVEAGLSKREARYGAALLAAVAEQLSVKTKLPVEQVLAGYLIRVQRQGTTADFLPLGKALAAMQSPPVAPAVPTPAAPAAPAAPATPEGAPPGTPPAAPPAGAAGAESPAAAPQAELSDDLWDIIGAALDSRDAASAEAATTAAPEAIPSEPAAAPAEPAPAPSVAQTPEEALAEAVSAAERADEVAIESGLAGVVATAQQLGDVLKQGPLLPSGPAKPGALAESRPLFRPGTPPIGPKTTKTRRAMREYWEGLSREAQQALFLRDSNTGLLNERALEALKTHEGRPYLAEFDLEGGKFFNDTSGHASVDGALRLMAQGLVAAGITDGVVRKGSVLAWVRDEAHANEVAATIQRQIRKAMPADVQERLAATPQGGLQVTVGVALGQETLEASLRATGAAHKAAKTDGQTKKTLGLRSVAPRFLLPADLPDIASEKGLPGLQPDSDEVKALIRAAAESELAKSVARAFSEVKTTVEAPVTPELSAAFDESSRTEDPFLTVYIHPTGLLTSEGFNLVRPSKELLASESFALVRDRLFPKALAASGDMRALRPINDALGREGADEVLLAFQLMLARNVPDGVDVAWPHGDEFLAQADSKAELEGMFADTEQAASMLVFAHRATLTLPGEKPRDGINLLEGVQFAYGIDADLEHADRVALPAAKAEQGDARQPEWVDADKVAERFNALRKNGKRPLDVGLGRVPRPGVQASKSGEAGARSGSSDSEQVGDGTTLRSDGPEETPRGFVKLGRTADGRTFSITLTDIADRSTFPHELGHVFLELFADVAERADAPAEVKQDFDTILKWFGVASRADITTAHHEMWAEAFETYLQKGQAPSSALRRAFNSFKRWLTDIYKRIDPSKLPDDVSGVFDRLLAAEDETARVRREAGLKPMFRTPSEAGMTPEAFQQYLRDEEEATSSAQRAVELQLLKDELEELDEQWKAEREKLLEEADAEYEALPARRAQVALSTPDMDTGKPIRLDRRYVEEKLGAKAKSFRLTKKGGVHPDEVAEASGFATGEEMLRAVLALEEKKRWVEKRADARLAEARGGLMADRNFSALRN